MKYYTKQWYDLMQKTDYTCGIKKIPDKKYTEQEIEKYYNKLLKKRISEERRMYNEPLFFLIDPDELDPASFREEDWLEIDEESGTCKKIKSFEEVKLGLEEEKKASLLEYENRPPFDVESVTEFFEEEYQYGLRDVRDRFPEWVLNKVDKRLLALDLMPESIYCKLKQEEKENRRIVRSLERKAERNLREQLLKIPEEIYSIFSYDDACILSLEKKSGTVSMVLRKDGICMEEETPYDRVVFREVTVFEREKGLRICCHKENEEYRSNCHYISDELYRTEDGEYEYHLMVLTKEFRYVTIKCKMIECERNIKESKYETI